MRSSKATPAHIRQTWYKVLNYDLTPKYGWSKLPYVVGKWTKPLDRVALCARGYHVTDLATVSLWGYRAPNSPKSGLYRHNRLFRVQVRGPGIVDENKAVFSSIRLVEEVSLVYDYWCGSAQANRQNFWLTIAEDSTNPAVRAAAEKLANRNEPLKGRRRRLYGDYTTSLLMVAVAKSPIYYYLAHHVDHISVKHIFSKLARCGTHKLSELGIGEDLMEELRQQANTLEYRAVALRHHTSARS